MLVLAGLSRRQGEKAFQFLHVSQLTCGQDSTKRRSFNLFPVGQESKQGIEVGVCLSHSFIMLAAMYNRNTTKRS